MIYEVGLVGADSVHREVCGLDGGRARLICPAQLDAYLAYRASVLAKQLCWFFSSEFFVLPSCIFLTLFTF